VYSETLLFLHQIFLKGLMVRMENWPTIVLGESIPVVHHSFIIELVLTEVSVLKMTEKICFRPPVMNHL